MGASASQLPIHEEWQAQAYKPDSQTGGTDGTK